jgi:hypothetical protein
LFSWGRGEGERNVSLFFTIQQASQQPPLVVVVDDENLLIVELTLPCPLKARISKKGAKHTHTHTHTHTKDEHGKANLAKHQ